MSFTILVNFDDVEFDVINEGLLTPLARYLAGAIATGLFREDELQPVEVEIFGPNPGIKRSTATIVDVIIAHGMFEHAILSYIDAESGTSYFLGMISNGQGTFALQDRIIAEELDDEPAFLELPAASRAALFYE